ncbi:MAG: FAD-dependent thymidylate synthase [Thaumarchaeota archaeon]|nr:FAD-dependent thymidylate synthase [Nitrososphaerota archaeon]
MDKELQSPEPLVKLRNHFKAPTKDAISAAKTCYSPSIISIEGLKESDIEEVGQTTYEGGHHTVYQHEMFEFEISNVSRAFTHDFLHTHPFYNTSQGSQRYVRLREPKATLPPFHNKNAESIFKKAILRSYEAYDEITNILIQYVTSQYRTKVSADKLAVKAEREIREKAMEAARYALSIAAHTHLVHTIDGVTLWRYFKMKNLTWEANIVVSKMIEEVKSVDPRFTMFAEKEGAYSIERSRETSFKGAKYGDDFVQEFDRSLQGKSSKLVGWSENAEETIADAVRQVLGLPRSEISDEDAIDLVLNPAKNPYLIDTVNLSIVSPLARVLNHAQYTFKKKISHTADSQDQRHRTIPGSRPLTFAVNTTKPDYITPEIIKRCTEAHNLYKEHMEELWEEKNRLLEEVPYEYASYVLPNGLAVRFSATGSLLHLWYKFTNRSCLRAEEEIWRVTMEEMEQINFVHRNLGKYLGPPCFVRKMAYNNREVSEDVGKVKYCNQGKLYCRQPVWTFYPKVTIENILRV